MGLFCASKKPLCPDEMGAIKHFSIETNHTGVRISFKNRNDLRRLGKSRR